VNRLIALVARAKLLKMRVRFVKPGDKALRVLAEFQETTAFETFPDIDAALRSLSQ
jgi:hypothetical protein